MTTMTTKPTHFKPTPIHPSRALALALTILMGGTLTGACTTLDTGGAGSSYAYLMGEMTTTETAYLPAGFEAARTVLEGRGYRIKTSDQDEIRGTLLAENPEGGQARIDLDQLGIQKLRISIRIGIVGDREESRRILDSIRSRLAA